MTKFVFPIAVLAVFLSCRGKVEPTIQSGIDECGNCAMVINDIDHGAVAIDSREEIHTFCSPVCMISQKNAMKQRGDIELIQYYLFDHNDMRAVNARDAVIVHGDFRTTMGHGLLAFVDEASAQSFAIEVNGELLNWNDLRAQYEIPDKKLIFECNGENPPETFEVEKDEVISVCIGNPETDVCLVALKGYDLEFPAGNSDKSCFEFVADRPGQGFVFVNSEKEILAALHVIGEHTDEEKLYQ